MLSRNFSRQVGRIIITRAKHDNVIVDYPLDIPSGKSDLSMKARVSFLSQEMADESRTGICGLTCNGFRMYDTSFLYGPIAVFPNIALSWRVPNPEDITPESLKLFFMLQPKLDVLVLGVGARKNIDKVRKQVVKAVQDQRIGLEIAPTEDAIPTFNFLNSEYRCVAGCFYPDEDLEVSRGQNVKSLGLMNKNFDRVRDWPFNEFLIHKDLIDRALERIYDDKHDKHEAREFVDQVRKKDLELKIEQYKEARLRLESNFRVRRIGGEDSEEPMKITGEEEFVPLRIDKPLPDDEDQNLKQNEKKKKEESTQWDQTVRSDKSKSPPSKTGPSKSPSKPSAPSKSPPQQKSDKKSNDLKDRGNYPPPEMTDSEADVKADRGEMDKSGITGNMELRKPNPTESEADVKADRNEAEPKYTGNMVRPKPSPTESEADIKADRDEAETKHTGNMQTPKPEMTDSEADIKADRNEFKDLPPPKDKKDK